MVNGSVGVQNDSFDGGNVRRRGKTRQFDVAESMKGEARLILLRAFSGKNEAIVAFAVRRLSV